MDNLLNEMNQEIWSVFHRLDLFKRLGDIIDNNPALKGKDPTILNYLLSSCSHDLVIRIGRLCDTDPRTTSLVNFLKELKKKPQYLTRERYVSLFKSSHELMLRSAERDFDRLAGQGARNFTKAKIDHDIEELTKKDPCQKIILFRHQYIAHNQRRKSEKPPTYKELIDAFKIIEKIFKRYCLLLKAAHVETTPVIQGNWDEVFTVAWITN